MSGTLLLLSSLALAGVALGWWLRGPYRPGTVRGPDIRCLTKPAAKLEQDQSASTGDGEDALPDGEGENGLAAFYAYQMAASRIERTSVG